eukprot:UN17065
MQGFKPHNSFSNFLSDTKLQRRNMNYLHLRYHRSAVSSIMWTLSLDT